MRDAAFFLVWIVLFPITFWSPHVGVILWIWTALISPGELFYGFMAGVPYNKMIAIATVLTLMVSQERKRFYVDGTVVLLGLLAVVATVSALTPIAFSDEGWFLYEKMLKILVLVFVISGVMWSRYRLHATILAICLAFGFDGLVEGLKFVASGGGHRIVGKASIGDNNHWSLAVLMTMPLLFYAYKMSSWKFAKPAFMFVLVFCVAMVIGSFSRGAFVGLIVFALMFLKNSRRKFVSLILLGIGAVVVYSLAPDSWFNRVDTINTAAAGEDSSFMGRLIAWKISTLIALDHPLFGGGFHAVQRYSVWMYYRDFIGTLDFIPTSPPGEWARAAHSIYFEVLGDLGFVGLALFLLLIATALRNARLLRRYARRDPRQQWAADLGSMLQISIVIYCVTGAAVSMGYFETFYVLVIVLSRTRRTVEEAMAQDPYQPVTAEPLGKPVKGMPAGARVREHEAAFSGGHPRAGQPQGVAVPGHSAAVTR